MNEYEDLIAHAATEPTEEELAALHRAVMTRLQQRAPAKRLWMAGVAAAIAASFALYLFLSRDRREPVAREATAQIVLPLVRPVPLTLSLPEHGAAHHRAAAGLRSVALITRADLPPLVKMTTADPNVIILLQIGNAPSNESKERTENNE